LGNRFKHPAKQAMSPKHGMLKLAKQIVATSLPDR
jgi:hypothetical protein